MCLYWNISQTANVVNNDRVVANVFTCRKMSWETAVPMSVVSNNCSAITGDLQSWKAPQKHEKEMVCLWGARHKTSVWASQMPPLWGGTEVWQSQGQSVMANICQPSIFNRGLHLHACRSGLPWHWSQGLFHGGEAQRPCLKTKILYRTW